MTDQVKSDISLILSTVIQVAGEGFQIGDQVEVDQQSYGTVVTLYFDNTEQSEKVWEMLEQHEIYPAEDEDRSNLVGEIILHNCVYA